MSGNGKKRNSDASPEKGRSMKKKTESPSASSHKHPDQQQAEQEEKRTQEEEKQSLVGVANGTQEKPAESESATASESEPAKSSEDTGAGAFPVVGIGASAGGLAALESFFAALPENSGIAFVVITHTGPEHASLLPDILGRKAKVSVRTIEDDMPLAPDTIYIPPSNKDPVIANERFQLKKRPGSKELHMPVDRFLRHLADERGEMAGCVILSGTGTDGTQGLRAIKEQAGVALAQSQQSARHVGMPTSAVETGLVDWELEPGEMPERLIEYFKHPVSVADEAGLEEQKESSDLRKILTFLANRTRHDFSLYKESTLIRRIQRRATVNRCQDAAEYFKILNRDPDEVWALFQDLLIGVTNFFRNPEAFDYLKQEVLPGLISRSTDRAALRVWVPGCSTGEEAYSVAIVFSECLEEHNRTREIQIFGTDIDSKAIEKARQGTYLKNIATDVSAERLDKFFAHEGEYYQIKREIREQVVFAEQNLLRDPPFSNLDLLVCRNLLIYLKAEAQNKLIPLFHYTLKKAGILFLGNSETVSRYPELFETLGKQFSIYRKKDSALTPQIDFPTGKLQARTDSENRKEGQKEKEPEHPSVAQAAEKELIKKHTPACAIVNQSGEIIHIHGRTGKYLEPAEGKATLRIIDMAREGLRYALLSSLRRAADQEGPIFERALRVKTNGEYQWLDLTVKKLKQAPLKDCLMVVFEDVPPPRPAAAEEDAEPEPAAEDETRRTAELEQELNRLRHDYRGALEELESSNEELRSVNEELQSSNEELQSTNEELESSREELQSLNEELNTVNSELHSKVEQLNDAYAAITNALNSTRIAIVFLDNDLRVQRFTEEAARLINLIRTDVGRPIEHIKHNLDSDGLTEKAREVLKTLATYEDEVQTANGRWYRMTIMAHRTAENVIEGVVLTFVDIDVQKEAQEQVARLKDREVAAAKRFAENIIDTVREALLVLDEKMRVVTANRRFYETFQTTAGMTEGKVLFQIGDGQWDIAPLRKRLQEIVRQGQGFEDFKVEHHFAEIGHRRLLLNGRLLREEDKRENRILLAIEDVTQNPDRNGDP